LEIGFTILGIAIGLAMSVFPQSSDLPEDSKGLLVGACIFLFSIFQQLYDLSDRLIETKDENMDKPMA
jgi:hypothetical protein